MPVLSIRPIKSARRTRDCCECGRIMLRGEPMIRLYGMADLYDKPSALFFHPGCLTGLDARIDEAKAALGATDWQPKRLIPY